MSTENNIIIVNPGRNINRLNDSNTDPPIDEDLKACTRIRDGIPSRQARGGIAYNFVFKINEGFEVFKAKMMRFPREGYENMQLFENGKKNLNILLIKLIL